MYSSILIMPRIFSKNQNDTEIKYYNEDVCQEKIVKK